MTRRYLLVSKAVIWVACLAPIGWLTMRALGVNGESLGANPVEELLNTFGKSGLNLLMLTLCITPIRRSTGINRLVAFRRLLGLFAFFFVTLHVLTYAVLDLGLAWDTLFVDITERPYITLGFAALVMLVPLAITSTSGWQRRLGRKWGKLHRLIYPIAILGVIHYWWQTKLDIAEPLLYAFLLAVLLGVRVQHWWQLRARRRSVDSKASVPSAYPRVEPP
jgi:sulfoxide reductase heme-binding subunit YedZ